MTKSKLITGPSYLNGIPTENQLSLFSSHLTDEGAMHVFNVWVSMAQTGIPNKEDMDPLLFMKLLPQIKIEEFDPALGESVLKLVGEFYKDLFPVNSTALSKSYYGRVLQQDIIDDWSKSDIETYQNLCPTVQFFDLYSLGKEYIKLGELGLPIRTKDNKIQCYEYTWKTD